jgi:hypothetical protein
MERRGGRSRERAVRVRYEDEEYEEWRRTEYEGYGGRGSYYGGSYGYGRR